MPFAVGYWIQIGKKLNGFSLSLSFVSSIVIQWYSAFSIALIVCVCVWMSLYLLIHFWYRFSSVGILLSCYSHGKIDGNSFDCCYYLMVSQEHTRHKHAMLHTGQYTRVNALDWIRKWIEMKDIERAKERVREEEMGNKDEGWIKVSSKSKTPSTFNMFK